MRLEMKLSLAVVLVCLIGMALTLIKGDWGHAGLFAFFLFLMIQNYRTEKRLTGRP